MAAATHAVGSDHSSSTSSSISPPLPPPWHPVVLVPNYHHHQYQYQYQHQQQVLYDDLDLATATPCPTTTPAAASPPRPRHNHNHLRSAASRQRAAGKQPRRPRPSRKLPTTYISADAASFRRMVHQVTGFDDDVPLLHLHGGPVAAPVPEVLYRQAPAPFSRGALTTTTMETETLMLPTLDTSAFLMLGATGGDRGRGGAAPVRPPGVSSSCFHGSSVVGVVDPGAAALQVKAETAASGGGGFPSLESWDKHEDDALFLEFGRR